MKYGMLEGNSILLPIVYDMMELDIAVCWKVNIRRTV